jgi:hypothetical protein
VLLRVSLLGGALFDLALALLVLGTALGWTALNAAAPELASHSRLIVPPLVARGVVQILACYDRERYDPAIAWIGLSLVAGAILSLSLGPGSGLEMGGPAAVGGILGAGQLLSWKATRG